ncbi:glycosyltransferase [Staphylococcus simiae]|uniref:Glycosyl transferase, group 1 family protein n=1 Tax=Staphylococcus simiae CCM 7213 = CCUG 51256 TaxID=911238 RepID=G5JF77_9STAP|nr:glycosyltransferase [Staphylococcus simiae]EHJ09169.1 glycosyl transferase, group 1 family protein [Staphylococcus simiae CCM 7213 = CCUG 51256]PNZ10013.1 glycosyl transferase family 1 [Staphylococcus simiae]SNV58817.1 poly (glycerol-phosphate) alpha-glucosyltransferase [Staphylococcus simiae]
MIYTVTSTLPQVHGGRTKSLLSRIKLLDTELNIKNKILTTNYNENYPSVYKSFIDSAKVTENIEFENIYDWLSDFKLFNTPKTIFTNKIKYETLDEKIDGLTFKEDKNKNAIRYYNKERYVLYRQLYENSKIVKFEDFMSPICKKKIERWEYNEFGQLHRKKYFSRKNFVRMTEEYFDTEGNIYCKKFYDNDETNQLDYIEIYKEGRPFKAFKTEKEMFEYYFENRFKDGDIVFNDARLLDRPLLNQYHKTKNILVFHNSHLDGEKIKGSYKFALENSDKVSKYLLLTEKQKNDIQQQLNINNNKIAIIPHSIKEYNRDNSVEKLDRFIFLGRLGTQKQLDHLIKAYKQFLDFGYSTKLSIYGADEQGQKQMMIDLINQFGIQDKVEFYDFTNEPLNEFQKSRASLLTSKFEGFGLTVMESIEVGCPVISYDVRYGPSEIINHGQNGYLVEADNIELFAKYMAEIVNHPLENVKTNESLRHQTAVYNFSKLFEGLE